MLRIEHDAAEGVKKHHRYPGRLWFLSQFPEKFQNRFWVRAGKRSLHPQASTPRHAQNPFDLSVGQGAGIVFRGVDMWWVILGFLAR